MFHVDDKEKVQQGAPRCYGGVVKSMVTYISEPGIYSLVFSSRLTNARVFRNRCLAWSCRR